MSELKAIRIQGGRLIDPYQNMDAENEEIWVLGGRVVSADDARGHDTAVVDARGLWVVPRLVDMHVHFRDPGQTWKENIRTGSRAAAHGGVAAVALMPNTTPVVDTPELVEWVRERGKTVDLVRVFPIGAVTNQSEGQELADLYRMRQAGAWAFSDDGRPVASSRMMRAALSYARTLDVPIINHAEDWSLSEGTSVHEGRPGHQLGLAGVPETAESIMVWRDVLLSGLTGGRLHVAHVSAVESLDAIRYAHERRYPVSAEVTPHHLLLSDDALLSWGYDPVTKVNPPLRPAGSRDALLKAVQQGLIDVLASDHAPHHADEKARPYSDAPFGISGLETIVGALITALIAPRLTTPLDALRLMTAGPDRVLGLGFLGLRAGSPADLTLIDPKREWTVDPAEFYSMGKNTPMAGMRLTGQATATMVEGRWIMRDGEVLDEGISQVS